MQQHYNQSTPSRHRPLGMFDAGGLTHPPVGSKRFGRLWALVSRLRTASGAADTSMWHTQSSPQGQQRDDGAPFGGALSCRDPKREQAPNLGAGGRLPVPGEREQTPVRARGGLTGVCCSAASTSGTAAIPTAPKVQSWISRGYPVESREIRRSHNPATKLRRPSGRSVVSGAILPSQGGFRRTATGRASALLRRVRAPSGHRVRGW